jgi:hypothetical protein
VKSGDVVVDGQKLCVIEAMKEDVKYDKVWDRRENKIS